MTYQLKPLSTQTDYVACLRLQDETWGAGFVERVPPALLKVTQNVGGVAAGAFGPDDRLVGFVYGLTGPRDGVLTHWSHMLAVLPGHRGRGIGRDLKFYQAERVRELGVRQMFWTFDPLVSRNAHFNLEILGAKPQEYAVEMYGDDPDNSLDSVIGTDRFVVRWELDDPSVSGHQKRPSGADLFPEALNMDSQGRPVPVQQLPDGPMMTVAVPHDIEKLKAKDPARAIAWRESTRSVLHTALKTGWRVIGFGAREGSRPARYLLELLR